MFEDTLRLVERIRTAQTADDAWAALMRELKKFGIRQAKYGFATSVDPSRFNQDILLAGTFEDEWEDIYARRNYINHDHIARHTVFNTRPMLFDELYAKLDAGELDQKTTENHRVGLDFGFNAGIAIPLRNAIPLSRGGISLVAEKEFTPTEFSAMMRVHERTITELVHIFHGMMDHKLLLSPEQMLSPRERECLLWVASGLRNKQIAHKLGIHEKTVEKQLHSCRKRLNARSNAQAAVKAVMLNLITP